MFPSGEKLNQLLNRVDALLGLLSRREHVLVELGERIIRSHTAGPSVDGEGGD